MTRCPWTWLWTLNVSWVCKRWAGGSSTAATATRKGQDDVKSISPLKDLCQRGHVFISVCLLVSLVVAGLYKTSWMRFSCLMKEGQVGQDTTSYVLDAGVWTEGHCWTFGRLYSYRLSSDFALLNCYLKEVESIFGHERFGLWPQAVAPMTPTRIRGRKWNQVFGVFTAFYNKSFMTSDKILSLFSLSLIFFFFFRAQQFYSLLNLILGS